jgi:hypothetical protein
VRALDLALKLGRAVRLEVREGPAPANSLGSAGAFVALRRIDAEIEAARSNSPFAHGLALNGGNNRSRTSVQNECRMVFDGQTRFEREVIL